MMRGRGKSPPQKMLWLNLISSCSWSGEWISISIIIRPVWLQLQCAGRNWLFDIWIIISNVISAIHPYPYRCFCQYIYNSFTEIVFEVERGDCSCINMKWDRGRRQGPPPGEEEQRYFREDVIVLTLVWCEAEADDQPQGKKETKGPPQGEEEMNWSYLIKK